MINTSKINKFNSELNKNIANFNIKNLRYINTYGSLANAGFKTTDGYNYNLESAKTLHESVKELAL